MSEINTTHGDQMAELTGRTERLVSALTNALVATAETAAERIELAAAVARVNQRMAAYGAVLDAVGVQRDALLKRLETARGATRLLLQAQISMLQAQEAAVLQKCGVGQEQAAQAISAADKKLYVRDGGRFVPLDGAQDVE